MRVRRPATTQQLHRVKPARTALEGEGGSGLGRYLHWPINHYLIDSKLLNKHKDNLPFQSCTAQENTVSTNAGCVSWSIHQINARPFSPDRQAMVLWPGGLGASTSSTASLPCLTSGSATRARMKPQAIEDSTPEGFSAFLETERVQITGVINKLGLSLE